VARVASDTEVPVTNAILAVAEFGLAMERAGQGAANKGHEAAEAAIVTARALRRLRGI
jgi:6,7-dimethyl-8-ribityllumazine synthase